MRELIFLFEDNPDVIDIDRLDILTCENCKKLYGDCAVDSEFTECESRFEKFTAEERKRFDQAQEDLNRYAKSKGWQSVENESQLN